jgi:hypothetical protein
MYITSRDQHGKSLLIRWISGRLTRPADLHDLFMIIYLVLNVPWMYLSTAHSTNDRARKWRKITFGGFHRVYTTSHLPLHPALGQPRPRW